MKELTQKLKGHFYVTFDWMESLCNGKALQKSVYAILFGLGLSDYRDYPISLKYLAVRLNASKESVCRAIKCLCEAGLVVKEIIERNGVTCIRYRAVVPENVRALMDGAISPREFIDSSFPCYKPEKCNEGVAKPVTNDGKDDNHDKNSCNDENVNEHSQTYQQGGCFAVNEHVHAVNGGVDLRLMTIYKKEIKKEKTYAREQVGAQLPPAPQSGEPLRFACDTAGEPGTCSSENTGNKEQEEKTEETSSFDSRNRIEASGGVKNGDWIQPYQPEEENAVEGVKSGFAGKSDETPDRENLKTGENVFAFLDEKLKKEPVTMIADSKEAMLKAREICREIRFKPVEWLVARGVDMQTAIDFEKLRKAKKAPLTKTALERIEREAVICGYSLEEAIQTCCCNGWQGFRSDWINKAANTIKSLEQRNKEAADRAEIALFGKRVS